MGLREFNDIFLVMGSSVYTFDPRKDYISDSKNIPQTI